MSLNDLPAELTALVVSYLILLESPDHDLSRDSPRVKPPIGKYACASEGLQSAVEAHMFRHLLLDVDDLRTFVIMLSPRRQALLRSITFIPTLPDPIDHECASDSFCQQANHKAFYVAMQSLYNVLHVFGRDSKQPLRLILGPPRDPSPDTGHRLDISKHSCLRFGSRTYLEDVDWVTRFTCFADGEAYVAPASMMNLLKSLPKVKEVTINMEDDKMRVPGLWIELRAEFARSLRRVHLPDLTNLHLIYPYEEPLDQRFVYSPARGTTRGKPTQDALSTAFHNLLTASPNLKTVYLSGPVCFDESLFWPDNAKPNNEARWSNLETLTIEMSVVRPDGGWYLDSHPDMPLDEPENLFIDSDDESEVSLTDLIFDPDYLYAHGTGNFYKLSCRSQPNESLERVLEAAARAAKTMPSLRSFTFTMRVEACPRTDYEPKTFASSYAGNGYKIEDKPLPYSFLHWCGPSEWKMSESLEKSWKEVLGAETMIYYQEW